MMKETANPTPSSTLAPDLPATSVDGATKGEKNTSIKLLIKASNQQHDDEIIESDLTWTVFKLKTQLSLVYPSKPPVPEQKLIYSGHLLNDTTQLKDIIRSYKDVYTQHHILHLVYTPKNQPLQTKIPPKMAKANNSEGLRQRYNIAATSTTNGSSTNNSPNAETERSSNNVNQQQAAPATSYGFMAQRPTSSGINNINGMPLAGSFDMQSLALQQAAMYNWMWQTYGQYMQQFNQAAAQSMTADSTNNTNPSVNPLNPVIAFPSLNPAAFFAQSFLNQQNQIPTTINAPQPAQSAEPPLQQEQQQQQQQQEQQQEAAAVAVPEPRFLNIVQEEQENRDWLDSFFSITRLALFLTVLYFNSSAIRCFIVFIIAGGIYLYHIGFFRIRPERNNNDINRNNNDAQENVEQQNPANNDVNAPPQNEQNNESAASTDDTASIAAQDAVAVNNNSTSVIAFMRTFIVTFFTSLLPETPAAL